MQRGAVRSCRLPCGDCSLNEVEFLQQNSSEEVIPFSQRRHGEHPHHFHVFASVCCLPKSRLSPPCQTSGPKWLDVQVALREKCANAIASNSQYGRALLTANVACKSNPYTADISIGVRRLEIEEEKTATAVATSSGARVRVPFAACRTAHF